MSTSRQDLLESLLTLIVDKDDSALDKLYHETVNYVYGLALRITQSHETAEEVVGDVYLQVWNQADRYHPQRGGVMSWLTVLCRSRALDALRRLKAKQSTALLMEPSAQQSDDDAYKQDILIATECDSQLHNALKQLDAEQRQLLALAYFRDYSHKQLANITGLPLGTVKSRLRHSLMTLQALLAGSNPFGETP